MTTFLTISFISALLFNFYLIRKSNKAESEFLDYHKANPGLKDLSEYFNRQNLNV